MSSPDLETLRVYLQAHFDPRADHVVSLGAGMFARAFAFTVDERAYVARINAWRQDFLKDEYARAHFASPALPIPRVVHLTPFDATRDVCVTERCAGRTLRDNLNADDLPIAPQLFATLDAIHRVDISATRGWGLADTNGIGRFDSWHAALLALYNHKFDYPWDSFARHSFFEQKLVDEFFQAMRRFLPHCPNDRFLIHRDFGSANLVADGAQITGVLDWAEFGYGDFLYDLACLDYFSQDIPYGALWQERSAALGRAVPNFQERMQCYMLNIGLHDIAIAATLGDERAYIRGCERTKSVLLPARRAPTDWTQ